MSETVTTEHTPEGEAAAAAVDQVQQEQAVTEVAVTAAITAEQAEFDAGQAAQAAEQAEAIAAQADVTAETATEIAVAVAETTENVTETVIEHDNEIEHLQESLTTLHSKLDTLLERSAPEPAQTEVTEVHVGNDTSGETRENTGTEKSGTTTGAGSQSRRRRHGYGR